MEKSAYFCAYYYVVKKWDTLQKFCPNISHLDWTTRKPRFSEKNTMKKEQNIRNDFHIRVHDVDVAKTIDELLNTNQFDNANVLLNAAVAIGVESLSYTYGLRKSKSKPSTSDNSDDNEKIDILTNLVKGLVRDISELLIGSNIQELLTALCFNMQYEKRR